MQRFLMRQNACTRANIVKKCIRLIVGIHTYVLKIHIGSYNPQGNSTTYLSKLVKIKDKDSV